MVSAILQSDLDIDQWVTGEHTELHGLLATLVNGRDVFTGNTTTGNSVDEFVTALFARRLDVDDHARVLT
ncbi:unannotated protein [freshwater metagenome]|uniref:Unannotated protein n=1 Tax=freshwater metagenome TaxID=449393 RepID=A0A6J6I749_9ZZZZ